MKALFYLLGLFTIITSCQKVIDVDLNDSNLQFVIEANYTAEDSTVRMRMTKTSSYFDSEPSPFINNAVATISDETGNSETLINLGGGNYILTDYVPNFNSTYSMSVLNDGVTYTSSTFLPNIVPLNGVTYEFSPGFFSSGEGYFTYLNYNDPAGVENYYFALLTRNGYVKNQISNFILSDDQVTDGNTVERPMFIDSLFELGDTVEIELRSVDQNVFEYYDEVQSIAVAGQASAAPANPPKMWSNGAFGYFAAYGNDRNSVIIE